MAAAISSVQMDIVDDGSMRHCPIDSLELFGCFRKQEAIAPLIQYIVYCGSSICKRKNLEIIGMS
jgi:hypothetical protein